NVELGLPIRTEDGTYAALGATMLSLKKTAAAFEVECLGARIVRPAQNKKIDLGNVSLSTTGLADIRATVPDTGSTVWKATIRQAKVSVAMPEILVEDDKPWSATVAELSINQDGQVTFARADMDTGKTVSLANPTGFEVVVKAGSSIQMQDGVPVGFTLNCEVRFPEQITDATGRRLALDGNITAANGAGFLISLNNPPDMKIKGFLVKSTFIGIDLSATEALKSLPADTPDAVKAVGFIGGFIRSASITLPDTLTKTNGDPIVITGKHLLIEGEGLTGTLAVDNLGVGGVAGFEAKDVTGSVELKRSRITACTIKATLKIDFVPGPGLQGLSELETSIVMKDDGYLSVDIKPGETLKFDAIGCELGIESGRLIVDNGEPRIFVSGDLTIKNVAPIPGMPAVTQALQGAKFALDDIGFDSDGKLYLPSSGSINLANPLVLDFSVVKIIGRSIGFEADSNGLTAIILGGGVEMGDGLDLPVKGGITFEGLRIGKPAAGQNLPEISVGDIGIEFEINQLMSAAARIRFNNEEVLGRAGTPGAKVPANDPLRSAFSGYAKLSIADLGGVDVFLMISDKAWFVGGGVETPPILIQIPPAPPSPPYPLFNIYGFFGGFGINVVPRSPGQGRITDISQIKIVMGQNMAQAGMILGDPVTGNLWWGEGTLTVAFPSLILDLTAKLSFLDPKGPALVQASYWDEADRVARIFANLDLSKLPDITFQAGGDFFLAVPTRKDSLFSLDGEVLLKISSQDNFLRVGWEPAGQKPIRFKLGNMIDGVDLEVKGGFFIDFKELKAGLAFKGTLEADLGLSIDGDFAGQLNIKMPTEAQMRTAESNGQSLSTFTLPDASGRLEFSGSVYFPDFPDIRASAYAQLEGEFTSTSERIKLKVDGTVEGYVRVFGKKIEASARFDETLLSVKR
ncbi:MAG: hypothetical protein H7Y17_03415, partial [Chlorobia bacterium]|nr:hypothetical protein [Fimbriimonadaceae bacterium]